MSSAPNISLPKPTITPISQPFWDNLKQKKLSLQVCQSCDKWIFYPRHHCPYCFGTSLVWREASGKAKIKSWSVVQRAGHPAWQERTPYVVGVVALEEGPSMLTHLWVDQKDLAYQKEVEISYEEINQHVLPFFKPRSIE